MPKYYLSDIENLKSQEEVEFIYFYKSVWENEKESFIYK